MILVAGYAASGKTRVGKRLARRLSCSCYLDKDTMTGPFADRLLVAVNSAAGDRDSHVYQTEVRPIEYECLLAVGFETLESGVTPILSAPFVSHLVDPDWMNGLSNAAKNRTASVNIVWVHCNRQTLLGRMKSRGSARDKAKLDDWPVYSTTIDEEFQRRICGKCFVFDNSNGGGFDSELDRLVTYLHEGETNQAMTVRTTQSKFQLPPGLPIGQTEKFQKT